MDIMSGLLNKKDSEAYQLQLQLEIASSKSNAFYEYFDDFLALLDHKSSFVRTRGFRLACAQAPWDKDHKIVDNIDRLLSMLEDEKASAIRQYLAALPIILLYEPKVSEKIEKKLNEIDLSRYKDSMSPLIKKDIEELRKAMP